MKKRPARKSRRSHRAYRRNPSKTVADPHGARELALTYDNERAQQAQKESIINNLARKMAKGQYDRAKAVKLWGYAAKSGADAYAKQFGSHGDTGSKMFNAATRAMAAGILESENRDYVEERAERFAPKKAKKNPSDKKGRMYHLVAVGKSGKKVLLTAYPATHAEAMTMKRKLSTHPSRRIVIMEAKRK